MEFRLISTTEDADAVWPMLERSERADGRPALSEVKLIDLRSDHAGPGVAGFEEGRAVAYAHAVPLPSHGAWEVEVAVDPERRDPARYAAITAAILRELPEGEPVHVWASHPHHQRVLEHAGFGAFRELRQLRRPLPAPPPELPAGVGVGTFRPGHDDEEWLRVYRAAFATHPDGAGWDAAELRRRMNLPWFDPEGFLMAWEGDVLAGFCWTKVHDDAVGEIYIVGVAPSHRGRRLGRTLVLAGLEHLHRDRECEVGMLYVDAGNEAAVALYDHLEFREAWVSRCFAVPAQPNRWPHDGQETSSSRVGA